MSESIRLLANLPHPEQLHYRRLVRGILEEVESREPLSIHFTTYLTPAQLRKIKEGAWHGLITEGGFPDGPPGLLGTLPMVGIRQPESLGGLNRVLLDPRAVARKALDHFKAEGLDHFGVFHSMNPIATEGRFRAEAFLALLEKKGLEVDAFPNGPRTAEKWSLPDQLEDLGDWLERLPTPCGILCGDDIHGQRVLDAALTRGLEVPRDIAVLGFGNDDLHCEISVPKLSSIDPDMAAIGRECVARLMEEIKGRPRPEPVTWLDCARVVRRESTDRRFHDFPVVQRAVLRLEADMASVGGAQELAEQLHVSHTTLNRQFRAATGKSTWDYIRARKIDHAQHLLQTTDLPLADICAETGIATISHLSTLIRKHTGKSPRELRS